MTDGNFVSCHSIPVGMTLSNNAYPVKAEDRQIIQRKMQSMHSYEQALSDQKFWRQTKGF